MADLELSWRGSSLNGAGLRVVARAAAALGARRGDTPVLDFEVTAGDVDVEVLRAGAEHPARSRSARIRRDRTDPCESGSDRGTSNGLCPFDRGRRSAARQAAASAALRA